MLTSGPASAANSTTFGRYFRTKTRENTPVSGEKMAKKRPNDEKYAAAPAEAPRRPPLTRRSMAGFD